MVPWGSVFSRFLEILGILGLLVLLENLEKLWKKPGSLALWSEGLW